MLKQLSINVNCKDLPELSLLFFYALSQKTLNVYFDIFWREIYHNLFASMNIIKARSENVWNNTLTFKFQIFQSSKILLRLSALISNVTYLWIFI